MLTGRSGKASGRKPDMHVAEESDTGIVPMKGPNKSGQSGAEALEGRPVTKGNSGERRLWTCTQGQGETLNGLDRIREAAKRDNPTSGFASPTQGRSRMR